MTVGELRRYIATFIVLSSPFSAVGPRMPRNYNVHQKWCLPQVTTASWQIIYFKLRGPTNDVFLPRFWCHFLTFSALYLNFVQGIPGKEGVKQSERVINIILTAMTGQGIIYYTSAGSHCVFVVVPGACDFFLMNFTRGDTHCFGLTFKAMLWEWYIGVLSIFSISWLEILKTLDMLWQLGSRCEGWCLKNTPGQQKQRQKENYIILFEKCTPTISTIHTPNFP